MGILSAAVQGGLIRRLVPRFGEPRLIAVGLVCVTLGFAGLALVSNALSLAGAMVLVGVGQGLISRRSAAFSHVSRRCPSRGAVFGAYSSAQTLARLISYSTANVLLGLSTAAPYWFGSAIYALTGVAGGLFLSGLNQRLKQSETQERELAAAAASGPG